MTSSDLYKVFRKRANTWQREQGELGNIVASEIRGIVDSFQEMEESDDLLAALRQYNERRSEPGECKLIVHNDGTVHLVDNLAIILAVVPLNQCLQLLRASSTVTN